MAASRDHMERTTSATETVRAVSKKVEKSGSKLLVYLFIYCYYTCLCTCIMHVYGDSIPYGFECKLKAHSSVNKALN